MTPHEARVKYGIGVRQVQQAAKIADERFGGNLELGVLFLDSASLAVNVKSNEPGVSDKEARDRWNEARARNRYIDVCDTKPQPL